jgi:hypothetical protein
VLLSCGVAVARTSPGQDGHGQVQAAYALAVAVRSARASSMVANTGIRLSRPLIRRIFATSGHGAMRPKPQP